MERRQRMTAGRIRLSLPVPWGRTNWRIAKGSSLCLPSGGRLGQHSSGQSSRLWKDQPAAPGDRRRSRGRAGAVLVVLYAYSIWSTAISSGRCSSLICFGATPRRTRSRVTAPEGAYNEAWDHLQGDFEATWGSFSRIEAGVVEAISSDAQSLTGKVGREVYGLPAGSARRIRQSGSSTRACSSVPRRALSVSSTQSLPRGCVSGGTGASTRARAAPASASAPGRRGLRASQSASGRLRPRRRVSRPLPF